MPDVVAAGLAGSQVRDGPDAVADVRLPDWMVLLARSAASKDAGLLVLRRRWRCCGGRTRSRGWTGLTGW